MYLSWSVYQLAFVLIWLFLTFCYTAYYYTKSKYKNKKSLKISFVAFIVSIMVTLFLAIDVGEKQQNINRAKFNQQQNETTIEKTESGRMTTEDVKKSFNLNISKE